MPEENQWLWLLDNQRLNCIKLTLVRMKKVALIGILLTLFGCTTKISKYFPYNYYVRDFNIHIINDSLQLYLKSPVDITYTTDKKELRKVIRNADFPIKSNVVLHGKTKDPPYEYFVMLPDNTTTQNFPKHLMVMDTIINHQAIQFIGYSLTDHATKAAEIDLFHIFQSLEVGKGYQKEFGSIMDIVKNHHHSNKYFSILNKISEFPTANAQEE